MTMAEFPLDGFDGDTFWDAGFDATGVDALRGDTSRNNRLIAVSEATDVGLMSGTLGRNNRLVVWGFLAAAVELVTAVLLDVSSSSSLSPDISHLEKNSDMLTSHSTVYADGVKSPRSSQSDDKNSA